MIELKNKSSLLVNGKEVLLNDINMISFKMDCGSTYYVDIVFNNSKELMHVECNLDIKDARRILLRLTQRLSYNGVNSFYNIGNILVNLSNIESVACERWFKRGKDYCLTINFTNYTHTFTTNKTIAERTLKRINNRMARYNQSVELI